MNDIFKDFSDKEKQSWKQFSAACSDISEGEVVFEKSDLMFAAMIVSSWQRRRNMTAKNTLCLRFLTMKAKK
jgi:hypothetical protein